MAWISIYFRCGNALGFIYEAQAARARKATVIKGYVQKWGTAQEELQYIWSNSSVSALYAPLGP